MQRLLIYLPCKGEYIKMAPSAIHINNKIHNQRGSKWPLESKTMIQAMGLEVAWNRRLKFSQRLNQTCRQPKSTNPEIGAQS